MHLSVAFILSLLLGSGFASATKGPRVRFRVPSDSLRLNIMRFSDEGLGHVTNGEIQGGRFYPKQSLQLSLLGAQDCQSLLDTVQRFPLDGMRQAKYITEDTYQALKTSANYLEPARVTFVNLYSMVKKEAFQAARDQILDSQLALAPEFNSADYVPVTTATMYLVNGYKVNAKGDGLERRALPWQKDPVFADAARGMALNPNAIDLELGRAMQATSGHIDYALKTLLITIAQEMSFLKVNFHDVRVFVHSYKRANTLAYQRRTPSLKVVAVDPANPENVILMSTLAGIFSPEYPWDFSGPIQLLRDVDREMISVPKAWNFVAATRAFISNELDYFDCQGQRAESPIVLLDSTVNYSKVIWDQVRKLGLPEAKQSQIIDLLNHRLGLTETGVPGAQEVDPVAHDHPFLREKAAPDSVSISNLSPLESEKDPQYEMRILFATAMHYGALLEKANLPGSGMRAVTYAMTTTHPKIAARLAALQPAAMNRLRWEQGWRAGSDNGRISLNLRETTAHTFLFRFADLERLAEAHREVFEEVRNSGPLRQDYFFRRQFLMRPNGL